MRRVPSNPTIMSWFEDERAKVSFARTMRTFSTMPAEFARAHLTARGVNVDENASAAELRGRLLRALSDEVFAEHHRGRKDIIARCEPAAPPETVTGDDMRAHLATVHGASVDHQTMNERATDEDEVRRVYELVTSGRLDPEPLKHGRRFEIIDAVVDWPLVVMLSAVTKDTDVGEDFVKPWHEAAAEGHEATRRHLSRAVNLAAERAARGTKHFYEQTPEEIRAARRASYAHSPRCESMTIAGVKCAVFRPDPKAWFKVPFKGYSPRGIYLLFHGGGWVFGDAHGQNDQRLETMADELGIVVIVPDYRKAPEHPYPAPLDDCEAVAKWVEENGETWFRDADDDGRRPFMLIMGGESAGANLCACTLFRRRDADVRRRIRAAKDAAGSMRDLMMRGSPDGQVNFELDEATKEVYVQLARGSCCWKLVNLVYGIYDLNGTPSVKAFGERRLVETAKDLAFFADCYCPNEKKRSDPDVSPLNVEDEWLAQFPLPPAIFTVGTEDALLDDTLLMYRKWRDAGHDAILDVWPDAPHGVGHFGAHESTALGVACLRKIHLSFVGYIEQFRRHGVARHPDDEGEIEPRPVKNEYGEYPKRPIVNPEFAAFSERDLMKSTLFGGDGNGSTFRPGRDKHDGPMIPQMVPDID